jgi:hypothetical protein
LIALPSITHAGFFHHRSEEEDMPNEPITPDPKDAEAKRNEALARYDAHPGIAMTLLAAMAVILVVVTFQLVSDQFADPEHTAPRLPVAAEHPKSK